MSARDPLSPVCTKRDRPRAGCNAKTFNVRRRVFHPPSILFLTSGLSLIRVAGPNALVHRIVQAAIMTTRLLAHVNVFKPAHRRKAIYRLVRRYLGESGQINRDRAVASGRRLGCGGWSLRGGALVWVGRGRVPLGFLLFLVLSGWDLPPCSW